jgi:hypothetical protein
VGRDVVHRAILIVSCLIIQLIDKEKEARAFVWYVCIAKAIEPFVGYSNCKRDNGSDVRWVAFVHKKNINHYEQCDSLVCKRLCHWPPHKLKEEKVKNETQIFVFDLLAVLLSSCRFRAR